MQHAYENQQCYASVYQNGDDLFRVELTRIHRLVVWSGSESKSQYKATGTGQHFRATGYEHSGQLFAGRG